MTPAVDKLQARLDELISQHNVVGASLAILSAGEITEVASGLLNNATKAPATTDSVWLIGSNSKVYTATLVMQLVDEGLVELDAPVKKYLPDFTLKDEAAAQVVTVRQMLTHISGIDGDYFRDFGRGDDACERYVASLEDVGMIHPVGEYWSYCNTGWVILGRIIEVLRGKPWHSVLREKLLEPAGLKNTTLFPEEAILRNAAVGHVPSKEGVQVTPSYLLPHSMAAAGSVISTTAADLLRFALIHLDGGNGIISSEAVQQMQTPQFPRPLVAGNPPGAQGLGWMIGDYAGERMIMHGGGTTGQRSFLEVAPDRGFGVACLTNGPVSDPMWTVLITELLQAHIGVERPALPALPDVAPDLDLSLYAGAFEHIAAILTLEARDGALVATTRPKTPTDASLETPPATLRPVDRERFLVGDGAGMMTFTGFGDDGRPNYVSAGRLLRRTS